MDKRILLRVDAGGSVGLGHFFRSINLANTLSKRGNTIKFIHKRSCFWELQEIIDFEHISLKEEEEEEDMVRICCEGNFDILFVDGIIDFSCEAAIRIKSSAKLVFYQNISSSKALADVFILPSIHQEKEFFRPFDRKCLIYKGLDFFTFNEKLNELSGLTFQLNEDVKSIAIATGGSDPKNVLLKIFKSINFEKWGSLRFNFYYGANYMHQKQIPANNLSKNVAFEPFNIKQILSNDLLISTFGVSTYEFMSFGIPILSIGHQESNTLASKTVARKLNAIYHLGSIDELKDLELNNSLEFLVTDYEIRKELSLNAQRALDLKGVDRVANILEKL